MLKTIIKNAYNIHDIDISEEALAELGRGGKRGYLAFRELITEKAKATIKKLQAET